MLSSNKHSTLGIFSNQPQAQQQCSWQVLQWKNESTIEGIDGWNWRRQITCFHSIYTCLKPRRYHTWWLISLRKLFLSWKNTVIWKNVWLQLLFYNRKRAIRFMDGCNWRQINSKSLKTETITSAYLKEKQYPWKYWITASGLPK